MLHGHGDDGYRYREDIVADFSTNVWYGGEPTGMKEHLFQQWNSINQYPEVLAESLAQKISQHHRLQPQNILVTNGTTESIYLLAHAFQKSHTAIAIPAFAEYEDACRMHGHDLQFIDWQQLHPHLSLQEGLFFICQPNNPTGDIFPELEEMVRNNPATVFIVDEAFIEFTLSATSFIPLLNRYDNLLILRSLTKAFAIPGLRLGYMAAGAGLIERLKSVKAPWSVNALAVEAGHYIFDHLQQFTLPLKELLNHKEEFISLLKDAPLTIRRSHTHFFLAELQCGTAKSLKAYLVKHHKILIRDASNFRGLGPQHIRLATLSPDKNKLFTEALNEWNHHCC